MDHENGCRQQAGEGVEPAVAGLPLGAAGRYRKQGAANDPYRPAYHFSPPSGWLNDPNGLIHWRGRHHLFYQHNPTAPRWGPMHWGHASSTDLLTWEHLPIALQPDEPVHPEDVSGIFSGGAVDDDGVLTLVYTIFQDTRLRPDLIRESIGIATSHDGVVFQEAPENPVIKPPPQKATNGFRDPKVFRDQDGRWRAVIGSGDAGRGLVHTYSSDDLHTWRHDGVLFEGDGTTGTMWETPDLFSLEGKHVLLVSANHSTHYFVGHLEDNRFTPHRHGRVDFGPDFYAAQTYVDPSGRRIMIGWMDSWDGAFPSQPGGWAGAMAFPRRLSVSADDRLITRPVGELARLRHELLSLEHHVVTADDERLRDVKADAMELLIEFDVQNSSADHLWLKLRRSALEETRIGYWLERPKLIVDRSRSGRGKGGIHEAPLEPSADGKVSIRVLLDRSSVEVFGNAGEVALSARIYPRYPESVGVALSASGGEVLVDRLVAREMKP